MTLPGSDWLAAILVCPRCKGALRFLEPRILCGGCGRAFEQSDPRVIDLLEPDFPQGDRSRWAARQEQMTADYRELLQDRDHTVLGFRNDYTPCASLLAGYSGRILDLGGGHGISRHFLTSRIDYVVLDPSLDWLHPRWQSIAKEFPCLGEPLDFVHGVAEELPFRSEAFDYVLALWSLNHCSRPLDAIREAARVLRPLGRLLLVLEDAPPRWRDFTVFGGTYPHDPAQLGQALLQKIRSVVPGYGGWPLQSDHVRIDERRLLLACTPAWRVAMRAWLGAYLTLELQKPSTD